MIKQTAKLYVEVADTGPKRENGLMFRKNMGKNSGMLFKFPRKEHLAFWMSNTYIPLDIAFIDDNGKIMQIESMSPLTTKSTYADNPCKYALEVNKGWFKNNNIGVGSILSGFNNKRISQNLQNPQQQEVQPISPDVVMNKSTENILKEADANESNVTIIYEKADGSTSMPTTISPPFEFFKQSHKLKVKAWNEQEGRHLYVYIDDIINVEESQ